MGEAARQGRRGAALKTITELPDYLLAPLKDRGDDAWFAAPAGKWSPAEIVDHVATAIEMSARGFDARADKPAMTRRPRAPVQHVANFLIRGLRWIPRGRKAPDMTLPSTRPERGATEKKLRGACAAFAEVQRKLAPREHELFLKHPVLGDLTVTEFMEFHLCHAMHHRKQVIERIGERG